MLCNLNDEYLGDEFYARSVLVTGASQGIGLELVRQVASANRHPIRIFATCPCPLEAHELQSLAMQHDFVKVLQLDVTKGLCIEDTACHIEQVVGQHGLSCIFNNAAVSSGGGIGCVTSQKMLMNYAVNVVGPLMTVKAFLPLLKQSSAMNCHMPMSCQRACVVNISSVLGSIEHVPDTRGGQYAYRTSKAALNMLTRCLSCDLRPDKILCVSLHPGWVRTSMGGPQAPLSVEDSVAGCLKTAASLNAKDSGCFLDWRGHLLPW